MKDFLKVYKNIARESTVSRASFKERIYTFKEHFVTLREAPILKGFVVRKSQVVFLGRNMA